MTPVDAPMDAPITPSQHGPEALPAHCEVLVVGAGPAGSACARVLAQAGREVWLVDARRFPRDKVCGDALIADSLAALTKLGLRERVLAQAHRAGVARCHGHWGARVDVPGEMAVLPRRQLDAILLQAAVEAGAHVATPLRLTSLLHHANGRVAGARLQGEGQTTRTLTCRWLVLATGGASAPLEAAGLAERRTPSGMAIRQYLRWPAGEAHAGQALHFFWHRRLAGGYGWLFPGPGGIYNLGTGSWHMQGSKPPPLREMFDALAAAHPLAARLLREGEPLGDAKGAPMRCNLDGAIWAAPGVLAVGEAAGSTYALTGEGIGKAMETGMAAAECLLLHADNDAATLATYTERLTQLQPRFAAYAQAGRLNHRPWLASAVIAYAGRSSEVAHKLGEVLAERRLPPVPTPANLARRVVRSAWAKLA